MINSELNLDTLITKNIKANPSIMIRQALPKDEQEWRDMWLMYNKFYGAVISKEITTALWQRILDQASPIGALIAENENGIMGFANFVLHEYTWSSGYACLMDDLFIIPKMRGRGAATMLISTLIKMGKEKGWTRIYWMTRDGNASARSLYDKFCYNDGFVRYTIPLDGIRPSAGEK
ncbi:MAG: N-acetyltransferase family protein [Clostridiaceae bacterium]